MAFNPENDADWEQLEMEERGREIARARKAGRCAHQSVVGRSATGEIFYPAQEGLTGDERRCTDGCGKVFENQDAWLDAMRDAVDR